MKTGDAGFLDPISPPGSVIDHDGLRGPESPVLTKQRKLRREQLAVPLRIELGPSMDRKLGLRGSQSLVSDGRREVVEEAHIVGRLGLTPASQEVEAPGLHRIAGASVSAKAAEERHR